VVIESTYGNRPHPHTDIGQTQASGALPQAHG
jgi:hypothetical protein